MDLSNCRDGDHVGDWAGALCKLSESKFIFTPGVMVKFSAVVFTRTVMKVISFGFTFFVDSLGNRLVWSTKLPAMSFNIDVTVDECN